MKVLKPKNQKEIDDYIIELYSNIETKKQLDFLYDDYPKECLLSIRDSYIRYHSNTEEEYWDNHLYDELIELYIKNYLNRFYKNHSHTTT